jgi:arylsulfatase A-like enzyme
LQYRWVVQDGWKLIVPQAPNVKGEPELYRLESDPREEKNTAATNRDKVTELTKILDVWWKP